MVKVERADKLKNQKKIIKEVIKNPFATQREIASAAWVSVATANDHINSIPKANKSEQVNKIIDKDIEIVETAQLILHKRLKDNEKDMSTRDIISMADVSAKRYSLLKWSATDQEWGLKSINEIDLLP